MTPNSIIVRRWIRRGFACLFASLGWATALAQTSTDALKTTSTITIDGTLNESVWDDVSFVTMAKEVVGSGNNTASFSTLWDSSYLYVAAVVFDSSLYNDTANTGSPLNIWKDDSVEVFIDADHDHSTSYDADDRQFTQGYNDTALGGIGSQTGVSHVWSAITGGYVIEMAIPWSNLGITPVGGGTTIGFDMAVNDDDDGGTRENQLVWAGYAYNSSNTSGFGDLALSNTTVEGTPDAPGSLVATAVTSGEVSLAWSDNSGNETGFVIERKTGTGSFSELVTVAAESTSYSDGSVSGSTSYTYRVAAENTAGPSSYSNTDSVTSPAAPPTYAALETLSTPDIDGVLNEGLWGAVTFEAVTRSVSGTSDNSLTFASVWDASYLYVAIKGLDGDLYNDTANTGSPLNLWKDDSVEVFIDVDHDHNTSYDAADRQCVHGYDDTAMAGFGSQIGVLHDWSPITGGYTVEFAIPWSDLGLTPTGGSTEFGFDIGLNDDDDDGTRDSHIVWAGTESNSSDTSAFGHLTLRTATVDNEPDAPSGLAASAVASDQINLSWTDNSSNETGFAIDRKTGAGGTYAEIDTVSPNVTSYADQSLDSETTYYY
ncbi:MAG: hypothetical protein J6386_03075 [Candidatus Synoicihabitans palmerolidicus]|nr:hypothetical protein [Candidatus Synoicihabitans palmerolidicus]